MGDPQGEELFGREAQAGLPGSAPARRPDPSPEGAAVAPMLERIEHILGEIHGRLELAAREDRHREFSPARLIGGVLEALVVGFVIAALADWVFQKPGSALVELAFAGVFQLGALTAFVLARERA